MITTYLVYPLHLNELGKHSETLPFSRSYVTKYENNYVVLKNNNSESDFTHKVLHTNRRSGKLLLLQPY